MFLISPTIPPTLALPEIVPVFVTPSIVPPMFSPTIPPTYESPEIIPVLSGVVEIFSAVSLIQLSTPFMLNDGKVDELLSIPPTIPPTLFLPEILPTFLDFVMLTDVLVFP